MTNQRKSNKNSNCVWVVAAIIQAFLILLILSIFRWARLLLLLDRDSWLPKAPTTLHL